MLKRRLFIQFIALALMLAAGLTGCSRTVEDISKWKSNGNVEKLIKALGDPKVEVRKAAADALGEMKAEKAVDALAAAYNDSDEGVVLAAVNALAQIGTPSITTPMIAALKLDQPAARKTAVVTLGQLQAGGGVEQLAEVLDDSEEDIRLAAASALGQIGEESGSQALVEKLSSGSDELRLACAESLGSTGGETAAEGLIVALADSNTNVCKAAAASLVAIGEPSVSHVRNALQNDDKNIRSGAISILRDLKSIPLTGADEIWYTLAKVSNDHSGTVDEDVVNKLAQRTNQVDTLIKACAHQVPDFREHAFQALETIGQPVTATASDTAVAQAGPTGQKWFRARGSWSGAPSWHNDLWGALAVLNPDFSYDSGTVSSLQMQGRAAFNVISSADFKLTRAYVPLLIDLLGDKTTPPPEEPDFDVEGIPVIKKKRDMFRGEANQQMAKKQLTAAGNLAVFPLVTAIKDENELIAGHAASVLAERGEMRALEPLKRVLASKVQTDENLSDSPFYNALQKLEDPGTEPILLKIRPNSERAIRIFNRKYSDFRALSAATIDTGEFATQPITFRVGYIDRGRVAEMEITFAMDAGGNWHPTPPLPEKPTAISM